MTAYFSECILNDNPPEADGLEGLADLAILLAIEKSAQTRNLQKIELPERLFHPDAEMIYRYPRSEKNYYFDSALKNYILGRDSLESTFL